MASKFFHLVKVSSFLIIFHFLSFQSLADVTPNTPLPPETICKSTPHPSYCISVLPHSNANVYDFGRSLMTLPTEVGGKEVLVKNKVVVSQDGSGNFTTINAAIAAAPNDSVAGSGYFVIYVTAGLYQEYVSIISQKYLLMIGDGINQTIITGNKSAGDGSTSYDSATLSFEGYQETLYTHSRKQLYRECDIYGTVDFIFGDATVVLQNCNIYPRDLVSLIKGNPMSSQLNVECTRISKQGFQYTIVLSNLHPNWLQLKSAKVTLYNCVLLEIGIDRSLMTLPTEVGGKEVLVKNKVVVSQDGSGNFTTINAAIAAAPNDSVAGSGYFVIYVTAGLYQEYVSIISQKYLLMIGDGINQTIITGNKSAGDGSTSYDSATLSFEGYQETLYTHSRKQLYRECDIYGTVDFIFGDATVVLQNCNIYPRDLVSLIKGNPMSSQLNVECTRISKQGFQYTIVLSNLHPNWLQVTIRSRPI
ncbi:hypothetical protein C1H46_021005 [Malus baccata]|uniref:Pectinesterase n=1 Tax=Malus baccata TaxID=106549 RepID=A0A540M417_MALBA|nr:hypothetical protein C1H46_021005 [Malus baccata]